MQDIKEEVTNTWVTYTVAKIGQARVDEIAPKLLERHHTENVGFAMWMTRLNSRVNARTGMSYDDLEDWDYWSAYAGDMDPVEAAQDMLSDLGYPTDSDGWV